MCDQERQGEDRPGPDRAGQPGPRVRLLRPRQQAVQLPALLHRVSRDGDIGTLVSDIIYNLLLLSIIRKDPWMSALMSQLDVYNGVSL